MAVVEHKREGQVAPVSELELEDSTSAMARKVNRLIGSAVVIAGMPPVVIIPLICGGIVFGVMTNAGAKWQWSVSAGLGTGGTLFALAFPHPWVIKDGMTSPPNWVRGVETYEPLSENLKMKRRA